MKTATVDQPTLPPVTDEMTRAEASVGQAIAVRHSDPFTEMVERLAANPDVPVDKLERLLAMQERILDRNAEAAFNAAFAEMQAELPTIGERSKTDKTSYAPLEDIIGGVRPILKRFGFAISHRTEWPDQKTVKVVGILTHREGHSRTSEFLSSADQTGSKNAIQALGSAVQYGRRYTTKDLLCIVTAEEDDDGEGSSKAGKKDVAAPAGFDAWWGDIQAVADEGFGPFSAAWNKSREDHRAYAMGQFKDVLSKLKSKAQKVTRERTAQS